MNRTEARSKIEDAMRDAGAYSDRYEDAADRLNAETPDKWGRVTIKLGTEITVPFAWVEAAR